MSSALPVVTAAVIAVTVLPGEIAFTRMPLGASSLATDFVRPITPCLAAVYACGPRPPRMPAVLEVLMMTPEFCGSITRAACFTPRNTPRSRMSMVLSHASTDISEMRPTAPTMPALLNITSSRPNSDTARSTAAATSLSFVTLHSAKRALSPSSATRAIPASACMSATMTFAP